MKAALEVAGLILAFWLLTAWAYGAAVKETDDDEQE